MREDPGLYRYIPVTSARQITWKVSGGVVFAVPKGGGAELQKERHTGETLLPCYTYDRKQLFVEPGSNTAQPCLGVETYLRAQQSQTTIFIFRTADHRLMRFFVEVHGEGALALV